MNEILVMEAKNMLTAWLVCTTGSAGQIGMCYEFR
jgi:hypothetical protein